MCRGLLIVVSLLVAFGADAESFNKKLDHGHALLRSGKPDDALAKFRDLQIEKPESELVAYSIASAQYSQGLRDIEDELVEDGLAKIVEARDAFSELITGQDKFVRGNARFNAANCAAQMAKASMATGDHEATVAAFEESIREYETVLDMQPDHEGAQANLNHMRYELKKLMQNPPPEQDQEGEGEEDNEESEPQEGEDNQEQNEEEEQEPADPSEDENSEQQPPEDQEFNGEPSDQETEPEELNRQNIEAILQSLEDQDREEQKDLRKSKTPPRIRGDRWW